MFEYLTYTPHALQHIFNKIIWHRIYGNDHLDGVSGNPLPPLHGLLFLISSKKSFICIIPQTG